MGVCNCSVFCCTLLYVHFSIAIILIGRRELVALLNLSSWCLVMVERLFLAVPRGCLRFVIVVFPDHNHLLFFVTDLQFGAENRLLDLRILLVFYCCCFFCCCCFVLFVFWCGGHFILYIYILRQILCLYLVTYKNYQKL